MDPIGKGAMNTGASCSIQPRQHVLSGTWPTKRAEHFTSAKQHGEPGFRWKADMYGYHAMSEYKPKRAIESQPAH
eukprot:1145590-Pelagomonas_calceolata.AAC.5